MFTRLQNVWYCITSSLMFLIRISARAINDTVVTLFMRDLGLLHGTVDFSLLGVKYRRFEGTYCPCS
jgi:hypothetical protein